MRGWFSCINHRREYVDGREGVEYANIATRQTHRTAPRSPPTTPFSLKLVGPSISAAYSPNWIVKLRRDIRINRTTTISPKNSLPWRVLHIHTPPPPSHSAVCSYHRPNENRVTFGAFETVLSGALKKTSTKNAYKPAIILFKVP